MCSGHNGDLCRLLHDMARETSEPIDRKWRQLVFVTSFMTQPSRRALSTRVCPDAPSRRVAPPRRPGLFSRAMQKPKDLLARAQPDKVGVIVGEVLASMGMGTLTSSHTGRSGRTQEEISGKNVSNIELVY